MPSIPVPVVLGPTAVGKSALALEIAHKQGWELVSCDSRQIYQGMNIGTAKPGKEEQSLVKHWLIDFLSPLLPYSAFQFCQDASRVINQIAQNGRGALVCGGTGFYFHSLFKGLGPHEGSDPIVIAGLMHRAQVSGSGALYEELLHKDPRAAAKIHHNDIHRVVRALAVIQQTGNYFSDQDPKGAQETFHFFPAVLIMERETLYHRINARVDLMVKNGLVDEFHSLIRAGVTDTSPGMQCVGYKELFAVERNECSMSDAIELIKRNTRRYAKRQLTWFTNHYPDRLIDSTGGGLSVRQRLENLLAG